MITTFDILCWWIGLATICVIGLFSLYLAYCFIKEYIYKASKYKRCVHEIAKILNEDTSKAYKINCISSVIKKYTKEK